MRQVPMFMYEVGPIDFWRGCAPLVRVLAELPQREARELLLLFADCVRWMAQAEGCPWEGDFREGPFVFHVPMPGDPEMAVGFAWKQDNNGDTFLCSPVRLDLRGSCTEFLGQLGDAARPARQEPRP